jgi:K+-sensing histidine kinase KdpD
MDDQNKGAEIAAKLIFEMEAMNAAAAIEINRIKLIMSSRERRIDAAKNRVRESMLATGIKNIETPIAKFTLAEGSIRTEIFNEDELEKLCIEREELSPALNIKIVKSFDKKLIKQFINDGIISTEIANNIRGEKTLRIK